MKVNVLPIVGRELRVASRRKGIYIARIAAPLVVFLIGAWFFLITPFMPPPAIAKGLFSIIGGTALLYAFMSGVHFTADSLSEEKREGTLGLLFLTDLKGYDVVLGKLAATSLGAFYGLLAMLPMLAVPLLIGGVGLSEVVRVSLLVINTMFLSLTAGLFVSSISRAPRQASGFTFLLLATFAAIIPLLVPAIHHYAIGGSIQSDWWAMGSPGYGFYNAFDTNYTRGPHRFWTCMVVIHCLGWIWLFAASLAAPKSWKDKPIGVNLSVRERLAAWSYGKGEKREAHRKALMDVNPFYWLASRSRIKPAQVWVVLAVCAGFWCWCWAENKRYWLDEGVFLTTALLLNVLIKGWFASECTRQITEDRNRGAFELILSTPLSIEDILRGQRLALQRQFLAPVVFILLLYGVFAAGTISQVHSPEDRTIFTWIWFLGILMFVVDLVALYWMGILLALRVKKANTAPSLASFFVLAIPWIVFGIFLMIVVNFSVRLHSGPDGSVLLFIWAVTAFGMDALYISYARNTIRQHFRRMAIPAHR